MKYRFVNILVIFILVAAGNIFFPVWLNAQSDSQTIQFHGSNVLEGQYANRQGTHSEVPKDLLRNDFQATLTINNIPIGSSFFITSEQRDDIQRINNFRVYIDMAALKKNKAKVEANNRASKSENIKAPWMLRFLSNFSKIEAGRFRPDYGELSLQGISVSGLNLELTHKVVYAAFATGNVKRSIGGENTGEETYKQKLMFGKFGFGEKKTSHFYLTYMKIEDETDIPWQGPFDTTNTLKPQSNVLIGAEFRLSFLKNKWTIDGEAGLSAITRDTRITYTYDSIPEYDSIIRRAPQFLVDAVDPNVSSSGDYGFSFNTRLSLPSTTISGGYKWIGPGYYTLGNPMLVNDRQTIDARIDQAVFRRLVTLSAYYKHFSDNLIGWKPETTYSSAYGFIARVTLKKAPYFQISFTPNKQTTKGDSLLISNSMNIVSFSTGYTYPVGKLKAFTNLSYFFQQANYDPESQNQATTQTYTLNQNVNFARPFQANFNASYSLTNYTDAKRTIISLLAGGSHTLKKIWKNSMGVKFMKSGGDLDENKFGLYLDSMITFWKGWEFSLSVNENVFRNKLEIEEDYNEFIAQCKLILKW